jgi:hypothetical protein
MVKMKEGIMIVTKKLRVRYKTTMAQVAMIAGLGMMCLSSSVSAALMMGGGEEDGGAAGAAGAAGGANTQDDDTYTIPTDDTSKAECYGARYTDLRAAFGANELSLKTHYTDSTVNGSENRNNSCTLTDAEAQCYIDRYADAKAFAGTNLEKGRKHYYETGMAENRDFACPPAIKELKCYGERYPDLQNAFGTDWDARGGNSTLYQLNNHWHNHGRGEGRDFSCP